MTDATDRSRLIYSAVLEDVNARISPSADACSSTVLAQMLDHVALHPESALESLRVLRDMARIVGGVLVDVLGGEHARDYLIELLVLVETAGILDDTGNEAQQ